MVTETFRPSSSLPRRRADLHTTRGVNMVISAFIRLEADGLLNIQII